ncbi:hypothetical protein ACX3YD_22360 [Pseudomonas fluorescens group sp. PF-1]
MKAFYVNWATSTLFGLLHNKKFCPEWDAALNRLLDKHWHDVKVEECVVKLGNVEVWIENAFYCYGHQWNGLTEFRPSLKTMCRLDTLVRSIHDKRKAEKRSAYLKQVEGY